MSKPALPKKALEKHPNVVPMPVPNTPLTPPPSTEPVQPYAPVEQPVREPVPVGYFMNEMNRLYY